MSAYHGTGPAVSFLNDALPQSSTEWKIAKQFLIHII